MKTHFIGLGGIGMSGLARMLLQLGGEVQGSDVSDSKTLQDLKKLGAKVEIGHSEKVDLTDARVVYSSSIQKTNEELLKAKKMGVPILHRADLLNEILGDKKGLLVTGTHGKTTTTSLLVEVLLSAHLSPSFALGGELQSLKTNAKLGTGPYFAIEADESDGSFLKTKAFGAIVTNLEKEHLDFWKEETFLVEGFKTFFSQVENEKLLFWCKDDPKLSTLSLKGFSYGFSKEADLKISSFQTTKEGICFTLSFLGKTYERIALSLKGRHNALNAAAVFGLCLQLNIQEEILRKAFSSFQGVFRRLQKMGSIFETEFYDDYAHHPTEIRATLEALRGAVLERRIITIFQPHRFSRIKDHFDTFYKAFEEADLVFMTDIYAFGESPIEGLSSETFYQKLKSTLKEKIQFLPRKSLEEGIIKYLKPLDVVITLGAGDISKIHGPIFTAFEEKHPKLEVALIFGGASSEHDISLLSAKNMDRALNRALYNVHLFLITKDGEWIDEKRGEKVFSQEVLEKLNRCDIAIPIFHGPFGEDGMIQGFLTTLGLPYVGCDYFASAICMQKIWTKQIASSIGIATAKYVEIEKESFKKVSEDFFERLEMELSYPMWVKPVHLGSSVGVKRVMHREEAAAAIESAFLLDDRLLIEKEVVGRQIEFAVLGNDFIRVALPSEILSHGSFYGYTEKYGNAPFQVEVPAQITPLQSVIGKDLTKQLYLALNCKGLARVDFFLDEQGHFWLNEVNPMPGFTSISAYTKMWEKEGLSGEALMNELILLGLQNKRKKGFLTAF